MAGMDRFDWAGTPDPTRAILNITGIRCFESRATVQQYKYEKGPSLSTRALKVAGVERFELPTRGFGIRCSANWSYTPVVVLKT